MNAEDLRPVAESVSPALDDATFDLASALLSRDPHALTGDDAAEHARAYSPEVASARAVATSARSDTELLRTGYLPVVAGFAGYTRYSKVDGGFDIAQLLPPSARPAESPSFVLPQNAYQLGLASQYPVSDVFTKTWPRHQASQRVVAAREHGLATTAADVTLRAREVFYGYARACATRIVAERALAQAHAQAEQARMFVEAGSAASVELSRARARVAWTEAQLAQARGAVAITRTVLATVTGLDFTEVGGIRENVTDLPAAVAADVEQLLSQGLRQRGELAALRALVDATTLQRRAEQHSTLPSVAITGNVLYANPNPRYIPIVDDFKTTWQAGASVSWSPNEALVAHVRRAKLDAERQRLRAELRAAEDSVRIQVVKAWEEYVAAVASAHAARVEQEAAEHAYRVSLAKYREESGIQLDVLASDLALTQSRQHYVDAVIDARISLARLDHATGAAR